MTEKRVTEAHRSNYPDPVAFNKGDPVTVGRRDDEFPGWIWVTTTDSKEGWAPESLIDVSTTPGQALSDYTARELDTEVGQLLTVVHQQNGWGWCRNEQKHEGWVPLRSLREP